MSDIENEVCKCPCHEPGRTVLHIVACCQTCEGCDKRIKNAHVSQHDKSCALKRAQVQPPGTSLGAGCPCGADCKCGPDCACTPGACGPDCACNPDPDVGMGGCCT